jgi:phytanoyl-CoA hydroxylase
MSAIAKSTIEAPGKVLPEFARIKQEFEENGFVLLRGFFSKGLVAAARDEIEGLVGRFIQRLHREGKITDTCDDEPFETRLIKVGAQAPAEMPGNFNKELHLSGLFDIFLNSRLLDLIELFLGGELRLYPNYMCRPKLPEDAKTEVLWHQDAAYTASFKLEGQVEMLRMVNCWSPLVKATRENGCMQFIPKSHTIGLAGHQYREHYLEADRAVLDPLLPRAIDVEMDPGDVVFFNNLLFHQGLPNHSKAIRWSFDWRYQDATQPTLRLSKGQIARSRANPERAIRDAATWVRTEWQ